MKKFLSDLLKEPDGKYSRKSIITVIFTIFTVAIGVYAAIEEDPEAIFNSSLIFLASLISINTIDKKIISVNKPKTEDI